MPALYRALDREARGWWYHRQLRQEGRAEEARRLERRSIRFHLQALREAYLLAVGRHGTTLYLEPRPTSYGRLEGIDPDRWTQLLATYRPDVPRVDARAALPGQLLRLLSGPMPDVTGQPDEPDPSGVWHSLQSCPVPVYLALAEAAGADVWWGRYAEQRAEAYRLAEPTARRIGLPTLAAWVS